MSAIGQTAPYRQRGLLQSSPIWISTLFVIAIVAARWDARTGFTSLLRFDQHFATRGLPAIAPLPVASVHSGYDGQFYAAIAVHLDPRSPEFQRGLDLPRYRARRILLPVVAHVLGLGDP